MNPCNIIIKTEVIHQELKDNTEINQVKFIIIERAPVPRYPISNETQDKIAEKKAILKAAESLREMGEGI